MAVKRQDWVFQVVQRWKAGGEVGDLDKANFLTESLRNVVSLPESSIPGVQGLKNRPSPLSLSLSLSLTCSKCADRAADVLPVKALAFPVSRAMHHNEANQERKRGWIGIRWNYSPKEHETIVIMQKKKK